MRLLVLPGALVVAALALSGCQVLPSAAKAIEVARASKPIFSIFPARKGRQPCEIPGGPTPIPGTCSTSVSLVTVSEFADWPGGRVEIVRFTESWHDKAAAGSLLLHSWRVYVVPGSPGHAQPRVFKTSFGGDRAPQEPPTPPGPPADAIVFSDATSGSLDARSGIAYVPVGGGAVVSFGVAAKRGMDAAEPRWTPDGSRIAFVMSPRGYLTRRGGYGYPYMMNANGTHVRLLAGPSGNLGHLGRKPKEPGGTSSPAWSPDGLQLALVGKGANLAVMNVDKHENGWSTRSIARTRGFYASPAWSPDGREIAYAAGPNKKSTAIFTIRPSGKDEHRLTPFAPETGYPAFSPDGSRIAYSSGHQLWIMSADGTGAHRLTSCHGACVSDFAPAWSPDGKQLVFVQEEDGGRARRLYILNVVGGTTRLLTPTVQWAGTPDWRPRVAPTH